MSEHKNGKGERTRTWPWVILFPAALLVATLAFAAGAEGWQGPSAAAVVALLAVPGAAFLWRQRAQDSSPQLPAALAGIGKIADYAIISTDTHGRIRLFNRGAERLFGHTSAEVLGQPIGHLLLDDFLQSGRRGLHAASAPLPARPRIVLATHRNGTPFPLEISVAKHASGDGVGYTLLARDVSEHLRTEEQLRLSAKVFESSIEAILITDAHGRILSANKTFATLTGYGVEEVIGRAPREIASLPHEPAFYDQLVETLQASGQWEGEVWDRRKSGEVLTTRAKIRTIRNERGKITNYIVTFTDVTAVKLSEERLQHLTHHDELTGLPNRMAFQERLRLAMGDARDNQQLLAVLFINLDRFKIINDSLQHTVGDQLLIAVAGRLRECVRTDDMVARLGGDEFAIVLTNLMAEQDAAFVARKILDTVARPFALGGHELRITASIGISLYPTDGEDTQALMKNADSAMFRAKEHGRNGFQLYTAAMNASSFEQLVLENSLRQAIERGQLEVHYQPKLDFQSGAIRGLEALLRWNHPELGMVSPAQFIPLAEETGLIHAIGEWVLEQTCRQHGRWIEDGLRPIAIAVNLSPRQFQQKNLADTVAHVLRTTGMDPHYLELELTESGVMKDPEFSTETLHRLRAMGVTVSIDDFGTGYSSLSHLKRFPISTLKIDRSFVRDVISDPDSAAIIHAIVAMARTMNLRTVAEGVETVEQLDYLNSLKCDEMQGYLFSPPLSVAQITALLQRWQVVRDEGGEGTGTIHSSLARLRQTMNEAR
jgi:diguanylate cyclase (GGDEF)-like protein/PAS domain S-box-containing protein